MAIRKIRIHDFGLDGFVYEIPCVGLTYWVFDRRRESSFLGSNGVTVDGASMCREPDGFVFGNCSTSGYCVMFFFSRWGVQRESEGR